MRSACLAVLVALAAGPGCVTPSIPIPPPEPERMAFTVDTAGGTASFTYASDDNYADAIVYLYNRDLRTGIITSARADGSVGPTQPFPAMPTQRILVTFETDDATVGTCVVIQQNGTAAPFCDQ